ncbi:MAG: 3-phosphoshikimate 1-carboxyvinyltransferase [Clostridia bacterium]|nr:3-phosphoshikimate 1-carboxyvinyltransferase [Clostridia bacterium]
MDLQFFPSTPKGEIKAPASKSMAHRMLICSALAKGESVVSGVEYGEDILATIDCIRSLGAQVMRDGSTVHIRGIKKITSPVFLNCRESGSTLRFLIPVSVTSENHAEFFGAGKLMQRPMSEYEKLLPLHNVKYTKKAESILVEGKLTGGRFVLDGAVSSQFVSGLLFSLPLLDIDSEIILENSVESRPYIDLTLSALEKFGIEAFWQSENTILVKHGNYRPGSHTVEGDYSNAAFFTALSDEVKVTGLDENSLQGDRVFEEIFNRIKKEKISADISDCPDLGPILFAAAAKNHGAVFTGTRRLKDKESDRLGCMKTELEKFGIEMIIKENEVEVLPAVLKKPKEPIVCHNDHRIAMAMSVLLTDTGGIISGCECVKKSMPDFFERLKELNARFEKYEA